MLSERAIAGLKAEGTGVGITGEESAGKGGSAGDAAPISGVTGGRGLAREAEAERVEMTGRFSLACCMTTSAPVKRPTTPSQ